MANIGHLGIRKVREERLHWDIHFARGSELGARPRREDSVPRRSLLARTSLSRVGLEKL